MPRTDTSHPLGQSEAWPAQGEWTYPDYKRLPDDGWRYQIIDGNLYMNPAPRVDHQRVISRLDRTLGVHVEAKKLGEVFISPIDVLVEGRTAPVQPDVVFVSRDRAPIVHEDAIRGVPDFIVEVLSPSNWSLDRRVKFELYAEIGVQEYWIVDIDQQRVEGFRLDGESYREAFNATGDDVLETPLVPGFALPVEKLLSS